MLVCRSSVILQTSHCTRFYYLEVRDYAEYWVFLAISITFNYLEVRDYAEYWVFFGNIHHLQFFYRCEQNCSFFEIISLKLSFSDKLADKIAVIAFSFLSPMNILYTEVCEYIQHMLWKLPERSQKKIRCSWVFQVFHKISWNCWSSPIGPNFSNN